MGGSQYRVAGRNSSIPLAITKAANACCGGQIGKAEGELPRTNHHLLLTPTSGEDAMGT
jgi:hypothetical protein